MPIKFTPKSESELSRFSPLPEGTYPFTVLESSEQQSQSKKNFGKLMCKVKLNVHGPTSDVHVYDYFADWFSEWKLKHFCESVGLASEYEAGSVDASENAWEGRTGSVTIVIDPPSEKDGKKYDEKNSVDDYVPRSEPPASTEVHADDVPF